MQKQQIIVDIQTWLNETYKDSSGYNPIEVNGLPGWDTTNAMLIAYQIEDGISVSTINNETSSGIYDFTKRGFVEISGETDFSIKSNQNKLMILQGAFYVKGINPGGFAPTYSSEFTTAVETLQSNAGVEVTGIADFLVVKALLSMDAFTVLPQYGGGETIATIQRTLNAEYANDMGSLIPCDGVYGRNLNKALIYALQIQEGFSVAEANEANGYFSPGTQSKCPTLSIGDANIFVTLLKYALYCNGYTDIDISSDVFDQATQTAIYEVQSFLGLSRTGEAGVDTWMALLLSSGNPNMSVTGCDVSQTLSEEDVKILKNNGYEIVGRYISGEFATSVEELTNILNAGLNVFPIYETGSYQTSYFSAEQGISDAIAAVEACRSFGIPEGTTIYFTVDYDMEGYQITSLVLPYFEAIYNKFNNAQLNYNIGIYGSRNVCSQVINAGYAQLAFVDGASTGYSGNMGFEMPKQWAFNQIKEGVNIEGIQVDNDKVSGLDSGFNNLSQNGNIVVENHTVVTNATTGDDSSQNSIKIENVLINGFNFLLKDFTNIKLAPKNMKWIGNNVLCSGPFYFADKNAYIRFEGGYKVQLGNGSYVNLYYDDSGFSLDLLPTGYGINISPDIIETSKTITDLMTTIIPTGTSGNLQFYPYWRSSEETPDGYYELAVEIGQTINENFIEKITGLNFEDHKEELASYLELIGQYIYIDVILGIKKDIFDWLDFIEKELNYVASIIIMLLMFKFIKYGDIAIDMISNSIKVITESGEEFLSAFLDTSSLSDLLGEVALAFLF